MSLLSLNHCKQTTYVSIARLKKQMLTKSDIPEVLSYRANAQDRDTIWQLIQRRNPRKLSALIRDALAELLEKEQKKQ